MNKSFYVIVPLGESIFPAAAGFFSKIFGNGKAKETSERIANFEKAAEKLALRVNAVQANLNGSGVRAERLNTEQIMQLYYNSYNFESSPLVNFGQLKDIKIVE
jgi:pyruvate kinase